MAAYNAAPAIGETIESILRQSHTDFECIIVDDCSTDATRNVIQSFSDKRIRLLCNETNQERCISRNTAIAAARGEFVAVTDADDISLPQRLAVQLAFMRKHPEVVLCGSQVALYEEPSKVWRPPSANAAIRAQIPFENPFFQSTVFFRRQNFLKIGEWYDPAMPPSEDYELWSRLARHEDMVFANVEDVLVRYRTGGGRPEYHECMRNIADAVRKTQVAGLGLTPTAEEWTAHQMLCGLKRPCHIEELGAAAAWLFNLYAANGKAGVYDTKTFEAELQKRWRLLCARALRSGMADAPEVYFSSTFALRNVHTLWWATKAKIKKITGRNSSAEK